MQGLVYFLLWAGLFFLMMRFGCGAHVMGHGHHRHRDDKSPTTGVGSAPTAIDIDPVCGMKVETATAKSTVHQGHVYYFCSAKCQETFEASPASFYKPVAEASHAKEHHHGC